MLIFVDLSQSVSNYIKGNSNGGNMSRSFTATAVCVTTSHKYQGYAVRNRSTNNNLDGKKNLQGVM